MLVGAAHGAIMPTRGTTGEPIDSTRAVRGHRTRPAGPFEDGDTPSTYWAAQRFQIVTGPLTCADDVICP